MDQYCIITTITTITMCNNLFIDVGESMYLPSITVYYEQFECSNEILKILSRKWCQISAYRGCWLLILHTAKYKYVRCTKVTANAWHVSGFSKKICWNVIFFIILLAAWVRNLFRHYRYYCTIKQSMKLLIITSGA